MADDATTADGSASPIIVPADVREKFGALVDLILASESMNDDERRYWIDILPVMTQEQIEAEAEPFIARLNQIGYRTFYKQLQVVDDRKGNKTYKGSWNVGIAIDVMIAKDALDMVVIGSGNADMIPLANHLAATGKKVLVFACNITGAYAEADPTIMKVEITRTLLEN